MIRAIRERGVQVRILTSGKHSDHLLTRSSSRRLYGDLLKAANLKMSRFVRYKVGELT